MLWCDWVGGSLTIVTVSERNVIIWDTILGSKKNVLSNICGKEITACCLDDRQVHKQHLHTPLQSVHDIVPKYPCTTPCIFLLLSTEKDHHNKCLTPPPHTLLSPFKHPLYPLLPISSPRTHSLTPLTPTNLLLIIEKNHHRRRFTSSPPPSNIHFNPF